MTFQTLKRRNKPYKNLMAEKSLARFIKYLCIHKAGADGITKEIVETYIMRSPNETSKTQSNRISDVRQFTIYLNERGYKAYVPPHRGLRNGAERSFVPYIFTYDEMVRMFRAVDSIKRHPYYNCAVVYPVLFRMLYCCGLRISEALGLLIRDVNIESGVLSIRAGKFGKDRLVPMTETMNSLCKTLFTQIHRNSTENDYFFKNSNGKTRSSGTIYRRFRELLWESDIPFIGNGKGPRLHDLRHTFCCHTLKKMSDSGIDMYCTLPVLSAYLGHGSIRATEKYLRLTAEFYPDVIKSMDKISSFVLPEVYAYETN